MIFNIFELEPISSNNDTYSDSDTENAWVEWVKFIVQDLSESNYYACAARQP